MSSAASDLGNTPQIARPANFTSAHEAAIIDFLADRLQGRDSWRLVSNAFDLLDQATIIKTEEQYTFREFYRLFVDEIMADDYLEALLTLKDVRTESPALWAKFARRIVSAMFQEGWYQSEIFETKLLLSYVL